MFKDLFDYIACTLFGHEYANKTSLAIEYFIEEVEVVGEKLKCRVSVGADLVDIKKCQRCGDLDEIARSELRRAFNLTLNIPYLAGMRSEGLTETPQAFFDILLVYPSSEVLKEDVRFAVEEGLNHVVLWSEACKHLYEGANNIGHWAVIEKDILCHRDALVNHQDQLKRITDVLDRYDQSNSEVSK